MNKVKALLIELRAPFLSASVLPVLLGTAAAKAAGMVIDIKEFMFVLVGFIFIHLGTNVFNDYFDNLNGTDKVNEEFVFPFTGGSRLIQSGILKPAEVLIEGIIMFLLSALFFIPLIIAHGNVILALYAFAVISGAFYVAPPFKWAHLGMGEVLIFLNFGPVIVCTSYFIHSGTLALAPLLLAIPAGLLVTAIVDMNEFPDYEADKKTGKKNLVVRMGKEISRYVYLVIICLAYLSLVIAVIFEAAPLPALISLITIPFSAAAFRELMINFGIPKKLTKACGLTILAQIIFTLILTATIWF